MPLIGTLKEKNLHALLKEYYQPTSLFREVSVGRFVADSFDGTRILEIQTAHFDQLKDKLIYYKDVAPVTVIYPVAHHKWIIALDSLTGVVHHRRKSPKVGTPIEILPEMYRLRPILPLDHVTFKVVLINLEETREHVVKRQYRQKTKLNRYPIEIVSEVEFKRIEDYETLIPIQLDMPFSVKDFKLTSGLSLMRARQSIQVLETLNVIERIGKKGRLYLYSRKQKNEDK